MAHKTTFLAGLIFLLSSLLFAQGEFHGPVYIIGDDGRLYIDHIPDTITASYLAVIDDGWVKKLDIDNLELDTSNITGLYDYLNAKSDTGHVHDTSDVTNLSLYLGQKLDVTDTSNLARKVHDHSNYLTNASPYNTNDNTTPFKFTRQSNTNQEYLNIGISDLALQFNYNNDEPNGRIEWRIENTDTETGDGTNANTTVLRLLSDSSSKLLMSRNNGDYYEFWHSGNLTPPEGQSSDIRFKTDIDSIQDPLKKVSSLKGISFNWKHSGFPDRHFPEGRHIGVIAQEVEKILPEVVRTDKDGYKSVAYDKLSAVLIEAVKEQHKIIEDQNKEIKNQKTEIDSMRNRFKELEKTICTIKSDMEKN